MKHIRLLPVLILVSALTFMVRMGDFVAGLSQGGAAYAEADTKTAPPPASKDAATAKTPAPSAPVTPAADKPAGWKDSVDAADDESDVKADLYKDLGARRAALDKREHDLATREALLKAGEKEVDQKLQQLSSLRNEIQGLMKAQSDVEKTRIDSLVKIYEGMKPEDAARIFNTLDMDTVMKIMTAMSERKSGPVLAAMTPERAKAVTQQLAQQKQLPAIPAP